MLASFRWAPIVSLLFAVPLLGQVQTDSFEDNWPSWRGPLATGESPNGKPPVEWDESTNVRWKVKVDGLGHSTPIVWGDLVFLTTAVPFGDKFEPRYSGAEGAHDNSPISQKHRFEVIALNRKDGSVKWKTKVHEAVPHEGAHVSGSLASASPVTDGNFVYASFGSYGLYCLNFDGEIVWQKDLGVLNTKHGHGEGISPVIHDSILIVNCDHEGQSFIAAFDAKYGDEIWRVKRDEVTSWSTPIVVDFDNRSQVIVPGTGKLRSYDLKDGSVIWECGGLSANIVASPVYENGMVFAGSSYESRAIMGISLDDASGDITGSKNVLWTKNQLTPYVPSPLLHDGNIYFLRHYQGVMSRLIAETGEEYPGAFRLPAVGNIYASPVAANGNIYVTSLEGVTVVFDGGEVPRPISINRLDEEFSASVAIAGDELFLRGKEFVYCIAEDD